MINGSKVNRLNDEKFICFIGCHLEHQQQTTDRQHITTQKEKKIASS
jgi:hypothetical protein